VEPSGAKHGRLASLRAKSANTNTSPKMVLSGRIMFPLDEVVGEQRPLDPELYRLAGVLSALPD